MIYKDVDIGNTPCVEVAEGIFAKFEHLNRTGSIKDRPIYNIIMEAQEKKIIFPGLTTLVEATSGNTGISVAHLGRDMGYKVIIVMPSNMSKERQDIIRSLGAELILCEPSNFLQAIEIRDNLCFHNSNFFNINQFHNKLNVLAHEKGTGQEIVDFCLRNNIIPKAFVCGSGTGGTFMGVSKRLRETFPECHCAVIEPFESNVMSGGQAGHHDIQGIGDGSKFLVDLESVDSIICIKSKDAKEMARYLNGGNIVSCPVGISAGANFLAAKNLQNKFGGCIVTVFPDHANRYYSMLGYP